jgi:hypothetical protein
MKIGANDITDLKIGATEINEVRLGSVLVWERNSYLLDLYPATAAYSLRKLRSNYTGAAIRVRRSLDNTEQDIGFFGNNLDTDSLLAFVGVGNGFVTTWYDQQGSNNLIQPISVAQPQIVNNSIVNLMNNKLTLTLNGSSHFMQSTVFTTIPQPTTKITVNNFTNINLRYVLDGSSSLRQILGTGANVWRMFAGNLLDYATSPSLNVQYLQFALYNGSSSNLSVNSNNFANVNVGANGLNQITFGRSALISDQFFQGNCQEIIIYGNNQSANRTAIETNINNFYNVY